MTATTAIALRDDQTTFDTLQRQALAHMGVEHATDADLAVFFHVVRKTGLDPFARQIHMIGRNTKNQRTQQWETKYTIQTGIDGYRLIARRAAGRDGYGYEESMWCGPDGQWVDVWLSDVAPVAAKVTVVRDGKRFPAVARYKAYVQTKRDGQPNSIWAQRDAEQLEKCAEALALRKAFPQDLSGIYTEDEMRAQQDAEHEAEVPTVKAPGLAGLRAAVQQTAPAEPEQSADDVQDAEVVEDEPVNDAPEPIRPGQLKALHASYNEAGITDRDQRLEYASRLVGRPLETSKDLTYREARMVIDALKADVADQATAATS